MTPAYASPEQLRGGRITPASDIYSLGVVLYELLANTIPFRLDERALGRTDDAIPDSDPEAPSAMFAPDAALANAMSRSDAARWRKMLRGDLDAIVLKALRREPEARYPSAAAFADDLRRVLSGRPVAARRGDRIYRTGKFLRRHRVAFAAMAAALVVAILFVAVRERSESAAGRTSWLSFTTPAAARCATARRSWSASKRPRRATVFGARQRTHADASPTRRWRGTAWREPRVFSAKSAAPPRPHSVPAI